MTISRPRGAALLMTLVTLAVITLIAAEILRSLTAAQRQSRTAADELQAQWLAETAVARALVQLRLQPQYQGETWRTEIGNDFGIAEIRVQRSGETPPQVTVQAHFPDHPWRRIAVSRTQSLSSLGRTGGSENKSLENLP